MGSVAMGIGGSYHFEGYRINEIAYCLYCDKCGSFSLKCPPYLPKWAAYLMMPLVMVLISVACRDNYDKGGAAVLVFGSAALIYWASTDSFKHRYHICGKCGNTDITRSNVLNYPADDRSVLDVSYEATIKYYVED